MDIFAAIKIAQAISKTTKHLWEYKIDRNMNLPKGAACPHLKPEFVGKGKYKAAGNWKRAKGFASMNVEGGGIAGTRECGFDCGKMVSGLLPQCQEEQDAKSIEAYCTDSDPSKPRKELVKFWRAHGLLH